MDENLSWRAKLAKANINITHIDYEHHVVYFDFAYRPYSGTPQRWVKTLYQYQYKDDSIESITDHLRIIVLSLRKELEA